MSTWNEMTSDQRIREAMAAASESLTPEHVAILRALPPGVRLSQAFALWRMARDALLRQELARGREVEDAAREAARRLLALSHDPAA